MLATPSTARTRDAAPIRPQLAAILSLWRERSQRRTALRRLLAAPPHLIPDIGLTPAQAALEADKPFWRA